MSRETTTLSIERTFFKSKTLISEQYFDSKQIKKIRKL